MRVITSRQNHYVKLYRSLERKKDRKKTGLMPLEGRRLVEEAFRCGFLPKVVLLREGTDPKAFPFLENKSVELFIVEATLFDRTAFTESPQGIMAMVPIPTADLAGLLAVQPALVLVADGLQDPGNLGTMLRSAAASGATGVILLPNTVDITNPKVLRSAMGANFRLPVVETTVPQCLEELARRDIMLVTTGSRAAVSYDTLDWTHPVAVVVGNEGAGVSPEMEKAAKVSVSIPMARGVESLNAAVAMSVIFFEAARQRRAFLAHR